MLSSGEAAALLAVLGDDRALESHASAFTITFKRHQHFKAACCLILLLEDRRLLKQTQRLAAFYILFELYLGEQPNTNPFMPFLIDAAANEKADEVERAFLQILLQSLDSNNKELSMKSASEFMSTFDPAAYKLLSAETLKSRYAEKLPSEPHMSSFKKATISNIILDPDVPQGYDIDSPEHGVPAGVSQLGAGSREAAAAALIQGSSLNGLEPAWVRPVPPRLPPREGEMIWQIPDIQHELLWDYGMCADTSHGAAIRELIIRALKGALAPT